MAVTIKTSSRGWREVSTTAYWTARCMWDTGAALYAVVQDTGATPKVRVMKADSRTAPTSWTEQDSGDNKTITNVDYPFSSWLHTNGDLHIAVFTATNTITHYIFDTDTDQWATGNGNATTAASNERPIRVVVRSDGDVIVNFTSSADDADGIYARWEGASWTSVTWRSGNSAEASTFYEVLIDSTDRTYFFTHRAGGGRVLYKGLTGANALDTDADVSTLGPTETTHNSGARFNIYVDGSTDKAVVLYTVDTGVISERTVSLEAESNESNLTSEVTLEGTSTDVGTRTPVSTAVVSGTPYAAWWDDASSGTIKYSTKSGSSWAAETNFATGITKLIEIVPVSTGLAVVYQSSSDVVMDWIVAPITQKSDTDTLTVSATESETLSASPTDTDTLTLSATEAESLTAHPTETETLTLSLTESETVIRHIAQTETVSLSLSESETVTASPADTDTLSLSLSESEAVAATLSETDSLAVSATEAESLATAIAETDTLSLSLTEDESVEITPSIVEKNDTDTLTLSVDDAETLAAAITESEMLTVSLAESETLTAQPADSDTLAIALSESEDLAVNATDTDTAALALSEAEAVAVAISETDTLTLSLTEDESVEESPAPPIEVADTDTLTLSLSESETVTVQASDADTAALSLTESDTVAVTLADTDALAVALSESESLTAAIGETDTLALAVTESETATVAIAEAETAAIALSAAETLQATITESDTLLIVLSEDGTVEVIPPEEPEPLPGHPVDIIVYPAGRSATVYAAGRAVLTYPAGRAATGYDADKP